MLGDRYSVIQGVIKEFKNFLSYRHFFEFAYRCEAKANVMYVSLRSQLQEWARSQLWYLQLRELQREGVVNALVRRKIQRRILGTKPVFTESGGECEVRVLTWRRDWINCIWALKTFYLHSGQSFALYIHDGGLLSKQVRELKCHFPNAQIVSLSSGEERTLAAMKGRNLVRSIAYRRTNITTKKLFDFYLLSKAERIISIDSDIVFFRNPVELVFPSTECRTNVYNRDMMDNYSIPCDEIMSVFGIAVPPRVNSGLNSVWRDSIAFGEIEEWLNYPPLFENRWVTEQTLHAMCSAVFGLALLPSTYSVGTLPGLEEDFVCKHYPSEPRRWLYREGMPVAWSAFANVSSTPSDREV